MITPEKRMKYKYGQTIKIMPLFDIHLGSEACDVKAFKKALAEADDETYFILGGDTFDSIIVNDVRYRKSGDSTKGDNIVDEMVDMGEYYLAPYKNRILGCMKGNHEDVVTKKCGTDLIARLCKRLDVDDLGYSGLMKVRLSEKKSRVRTVVIRYHHGWGGGARTEGGPVTSFSKDMMFWDANVFLYGHVHRRAVHRTPRLGLVGNKLVSKPMILGICGTYLRTYTKGIQPTYSEVKGYPPVEIGSILVSITPNRDWVTLGASTIN